MTPEQLKWGDEQWAKYLDCSVEKFQQARELIQNNYIVGVVIKDNRYSVVIEKLHSTPSGSDRLNRFIIKAESRQSFDKLNDAVQYANEKFIPSLAFNDTIAKIYDVPAKILQTLHIKQK